MRRFALLLSVALVAASAPVLSPAASAAPPNAAPPAATEPAAVPDQLLVGYDIGTSAAERADARGQAGARRIEDVVRGDGDRRAVELVALPSGSDRDAAIRRFEQNPNVAYAEPNWIVTHQAEPADMNDPYYKDGSLWGMYGDGTSPANQYGSQAGEAWSAGTGNTGSPSVVVGVIDEGIEITHPDLKGNIWVNPYDPTDGVDNDGNGYVDDTNGWDFHGGNRTVYDGTGDDHGTHVAGTIAAVGGNGTGVAGVAWDATMISAKFLGPNGGSTANAVKAVDYLTDLKTRHGMNIVASNNSWGGGGHSQALLDAITAAGAADILFVAAAGNDSANNDTTDRYPSGYESDNIIAVASIDKTGNLSSFSNYGATTVDLGAPGRDIYSTVPGGTYGSYSGTSMATPHVTGGVVLAAAAGTPGATDLRNAILTNVVPTNSLAGKTLTGGRLNVSGFGPAIASPNTAPVAVDDSYKTTQGQTLIVDAPGVLGNDTDLEEETLTASHVSGPSNGALTLNSEGDFVYTPNLDFSGSDSFDYVAHDGELPSSAATVTITVTAAATKTKGGGGGAKGGNKPSVRGASTR